MIGFIIIIAFVVWLAGFTIAIDALNIRQKGLRILLSLGSWGTLLGVFVFACVWDVIENLRNH